ncbi:MAG: hypothetical protein WBZ48_00370 [Bacteroidota bacterium]
MNRVRQTAIFVLAFVLAVLTLFVVGCKKSSSPVAPTTIPITTDIFPLTVGHKITYTGYLRSVGADTNITTGATYSSTWTVVSNDTASPLGGTSNLIIDSITAPSPSATPLYILRTPPTGEADFWFLENILLPQGDSLNWILVGNIGDGVAAFWTAFDDSLRTPDSVYDLKVAGQFADEESLSVGGQMFNTYRTTLTQFIIVDGVVRGNGIGVPLATYWFAPGIGPVKIIVDATEQKNGYEWDFKSKNF